MYCILKFAKRVDLSAPTTYIHKRYLCEVMLFNLILAIVSQ